MARTTAFSSQMSPSMLSISSPARLPRGLAARTNARTEYPAARKARTIADPTNPVAPVTSTRPASLIDWESPIHRLPGKPELPGDRQPFHRQRVGDQQHLCWDECRGECRD